MKAFVRGIMAVLISIGLYGLFLFGWKSFWGENWIDVALIFTALDYYFLGWLVTLIGTPLYSWARGRKSAGCLLSFVWPYAWCLLLGDLIIHPPFIHHDTKAEAEGSFGMNFEEDTPDPYLDSL